MANEKCYYISTEGETSARDEFWRELEKRWGPLERHYSTSLETLTFAAMGKPKIQKVIFNNPATIILWTDGTKTVVKCQPGDIYDKEKGFVMAYLKKLLGNDNTFNKEINKWVEEESIALRYTRIGERLAEGLMAMLAKFGSTSITAMDEMHEVDADHNHQCIIQGASTKYLPKSTTDEEEGCKVCREHKDKIARKYAVVGGHSLGNFTHCPYCGRKLKEESK